MAAWVVVLTVGIALGLTAMGYYAGYHRGRAEVLAAWLDDEGEEEDEKPDSRDEMLAEMMRRFMDLTLPATSTRGAGGGGEDEELPPTPGEYVPPDDDWDGAADWTDRLLASHQDRPLVARLAPGESPIPTAGGQEATSPVEEWRERGTAAFDVWAEQTAREDGEVLNKAWVDPIHLDGEVRG